MHALLMVQLRIAVQRPDIVQEYVQTVGGGHMFGEIANLDT